MVLRYEEDQSRHLAKYHPVLSGYFTVNILLYDVKLFWYNNDDEEDEDGEDDDYDDNSDGNFLGFFLVRKMKVSIV